MEDVILAVLTQLKAFPQLSFAKECAYIAEDPYELLEKNRFPFYNVFPGDERVVETDGIPFSQFERHIYPVTIQFATRSLRINVAIMGDVTTGAVGILKFSDYIWNAITFDRTLGGLVDGLMPKTDVPKDFLKDNDQFIARSEIVMEFFKDVALL